ncbi:MAG: hypothetical protein IJU82_09310 [Ruminiclostridium sp.]|nr:hypothetical protein [Ruminiclostridium sp.]
MRRHNEAVRIKVSADFSFFAVLGFLICVDKDGTALLCMLACVLHELGHLAVMFAERRTPDRIRFYGGGIHISGGSTSFLCVSAGIAVNIVLFLLFGLIPWAQRELRLFGVVNLLIAAVNLLPVGSLDGKLMLEKALVRGFSPERAVFLSELCERVMLVILVPAAAMLFFSGFMNISAIIFLIYIFAVEFLEKI